MPPYLSAIPPEPCSRTTTLTTCLWYLNLKKLWRESDSSEIGCCSSPLVSAGKSCDEILAARFQAEVLTSWPSRSPVSIPAGLFVFLEVLTSWPSRSPVSIPIRKQPPC